MDFDYEQFDLWLNNELYLRQKKSRNTIISITKKCISKSLKLSDYEEMLDEKGFDEITIKNISDYVMIWNKRNEENIKMNKKNEDYKFIKNISKISVFKICKDLNVDYANLMKGKSSFETTRKVKEELERQLKNIVN